MNVSDWLNLSPSLLSDWLNLSPSVFSDWLNLSPSLVSDWLNISPSLLLEGGASAMDRGYTRSMASAAYIREPVWPSGKTSGLYAEEPQFESASALLSLQKLSYADSLVTLSHTINETLKWFSSLPILMQESFWW